MAEILKTFEFRNRGGGAFYPWEEWFDGKIRRLVRGKDFTVPVHGFRAIASQAAKRHGVTVHICGEGNGSAMLQAVPHNGVNGKKRR